MQVSINSFADLAQRRPTTAKARHLSEAFINTHPDFSTPVGMVESNFKKALELEKNALVLLNDLSKPAQEIVNEVYQKLQAKASALLHVDQTSKIIDAAVEPEFTRDFNLKFLISNASPKVVYIPEFLQRDKDFIFEQAKDLNDLHRDIRQESRNLYSLRAQGNLQELYPNLKERLNELQSLKGSAEVDFVKKYLEEKIEAWNNPDQLSQRGKSLEYNSLIGQCARCALYYGAPLTQTIDLINNFFDVNQLDPFTPIPVIDPKTSNPNLGNLVVDPMTKSTPELQPSYHLLQTDIPLAPIDAIRLAMLENYPTTNPKDPKSTFIKSLQNLDQAQKIHYDGYNVRSKFREPHFMGTGSWAELRTGIALVKIQAEHERLYLSSDNNISNEPIMVTGVIPAKRHYDKAGVDFWIKAINRDNKNEFYIPLQVKNTKKTLEEHVTRTGYINSAVTVSGKPLQRLMKDLREQIKNPRIIVSKRDFDKLEMEFRNNPKENSKNHKKLISFVQQILRGTRTRI